MLALVLLIVQTILTFPRLQYLLTRELFIVYIAGLPTLCLKKVRKLREVLNVRHGPAQAPFLSGVTEIFLQDGVKILKF